MNISKIRHIMADEGIVFSFSGMISQSLTSFMVETAKTQLKGMGEDVKTTRNIFSIAVEQLQNAMNYSKEKHIQAGNKYTSPGVLVIGYSEKKDKYYINTSNEIINSDIEKVTTKLNLINSLGKEELKKLLRHKLRSAEDLHERGAGIGFIEMAKHSSEKLEYDFEKIDGKTYFHILAYI